MKLVIHSKETTKLREKIENYLKEDAKTWLYIGDHETKSNTIRPVFTHKSENYKDKAKFILLNDIASGCVFIHFIEKESGDKEVQYIGMLVSLMLNNFLSDFSSLTVQK